MREEMEVQRTAVRKYFVGNSVLPIILIVVGVFTLAIIIGIVLIIIGVVMMFMGDYSGESQVDSAMGLEIERLKKRGLEKLNVIDEQINMVQPIYFYGPGSSPDGSLSATEADMVQQSAWKKIFGIFKKNNVSLDPIEAFRVGSDDKLRFMLVQVTVYAFSEEQLLIYIGNVDISTGKIYEEGTIEIFYQDIAGIAMSQSLFKLFNKKKKKFVYKMKEFVTVQGNGISYVARMDAELNNSFIEQQFAGMRSLIRERKNR